MWRARTRRGRVTSLAASIAAAVAVVTPATPAAAFDSTFGGGDGIATFSNLGDVDAQYARDVLVQPDGRIVVGANVAAGNGNDDFAILRLNPDGSPDGSFGPNHDGRVVFPVGSEGGQFLSELALQPDGKIVAVGEAGGTSDTADIAVARVDSTGNLDPTFGSGGTTTFSLADGANDDWGIGVAFQPGGKIVVGAGTGYGDYDFALVRLESNGALDDGGAGDPNPGDSFQGTGSKIVDSGLGRDFPSAMAQQSDGRIVMAGSIDTDAAHVPENYDFGLVRVEEDGDVDPGFAGGGFATVGFDQSERGGDGADGLALQPDGKIVVAGGAEAPSDASGTDWALARFTAGGQLDSSFGGGGRVSFDHGSAFGDETAFDVAVQPDGRIVATGTAWTSDGFDDLAFARLTPGGALDPSFDGDGKWSFALTAGANSEWAEALTVDGGRILAAGGAFRSGGVDALVLRLLQDDGDHDGVADAQDNCPALANKDQLNSDGRGAGDACNADADRDERDDDADNCPSARNPDQADGDSDGQGDACDADHDNDGLANAQDGCPTQAGLPPSGCPPTGGDDRIFGTAGPDRLCGLLGNDEINGLAGDDTLFGDACDDRTKRIAGAQVADGNDRLVGAEGDDTLYGAGGNDILFGVSGNDRLFGGDGNDRLNGDTGNDKLSGDAGNDTLTGWKGSDVLSGGKGRDTLDAGDGNDKLTGGPDVNKYRAGAGNDSVNARNGKRETVDCGSGKKDSATVDRADKVKGCEKVKRAKK